MLKAKVVTELWSKFVNKDLHTFTPYQILSPLGRPRHRWENNIKMDIQEVGGGCGDWMELAQDRDRWRALVSMVMNLRVP